jgi:hypothetical protein
MSPAGENLNDIEGAANAYANVRKVLAHSPDRSGQIGPATSSDRKCRAVSADFGRWWPLARCPVPRSFLILNEGRRNRPPRAVSTRKDCSGAKI